MKSITLGLALSAALSAGVATAETRVATGALAPNERLRVIERISGAEYYISAPHPTEDGRLMVWSWGFYPRAGYSDGFDTTAHQEIFDCKAGTYQDLRQENYDWPKPLAAYTHDTPPLQPIPIIEEVNILKVVCDPAALAGGEWVDSVDAAHQIASRRLGSLR